MFLLIKPLQFIETVIQPVILKLYIILIVLVTFGAIVVNWFFLREGFFSHNMIIITVLTFKRSYRRFVTNSKLNQELTEIEQ